MENEKKKKKKKKKTNAKSIIKNKIKKIMGKLKI